MIISVEKAKEFVNLEGWTDAKIEMKLKAIEQTIRAYTNNNFQDRGYRVRASIQGGAIVSSAPMPFSANDTVQISESVYNNGLYTLLRVLDDTAYAVSDLKDDMDVLITKVAYPADVIECALNMLEWEKEHRAKVGIQSETLSRHSVSYFNMDGANQTMGYPSSLLGCLKPYRKLRF